MVVAKLEILTLVKTGGLTSGFTKASSSVAAFAQKVSGVDKLLKAAFAYFSIRKVGGWISDSLQELAKTERGAYNAVAALKGVRDMFSSWGQTIARDVAPYLEAAAQGFVDATNGMSSFNEQQKTGSEASSVWGSILTGMATVAQALWIPFQALSVAIWTIVKGLTVMVKNLAKLESLLPKSAQIGIAQLAEEIDANVTDIWQQAKDNLANNWNDLWSGNTWGKKWEAAAQEARDRAEKQGPVMPKIADKLESPAALLRYSKEAYSASLKAGRIMESSMSPEVKATKEVKAAVEKSNRTFEEFHRDLLDKNMEILFARLG